MWEKARPVMHVIGEVSDGWERFGKYVPAAIFPSPCIANMGFIAPCLPPRLSRLRSRACVSQQ